MAKWSRVEHVCLQAFGGQVKASKAVTVSRVHLFKTHRILEVIAVKARPTRVTVSCFSGHQIALFTPLHSTAFQGRKKWSKMQLY